jgi:hypothetical protein
MSFWNDLKDRHARFKATPEYKIGRLSAKHTMIYFIPMAVVTILMTSYMEQHVAREICMAVGVTALIISRIYSRKIGRRKAEEEFYKGENA